LKVLVIGSAGFIGTHLVAHLRAEGHQVEGWGRRPSDGGASDRYFAVDLLDRSSLAEHEGPWDAAVLLAGYSVPNVDWTTEMALENLRICANALEHLSEAAPGIRVLVASSAAVYALGPGRRREEEAPRPRNLYGLSKLLCEDWCRCRADRLDVQVVRLFNQLGPGMPAGLVVPDLLRSLREGSGPIEMRGADSVRDFMDVRDGVKGLTALLAVDVPAGSVWNLCTGERVSILNLARLLMTQLGQDRPLSFADGEITELVGDPTRLGAATRWAPEYRLEDSIAAILSVPGG
jgi:nucleoside-diphosphate-sugar epimerase